MILNVKDHRTGVTFKITTRSLLVKDLKAEIAQRESVDSGSFNLWFKNVYLSDMFLLSQYNVAEGGLIIKTPKVNRYRKFLGDSLSIWLAGIAWGIGHALGIVLTKNLQHLRPIN